MTSNKPTNCPDTSNIISDQLIMSFRCLDVKELKMVLKMKWKL